MFLSESTSFRVFLFSFLAFFFASDASAIVDGEDATAEYPWMGAVVQDIDASFLMNNNRRFTLGHISEVQCGATLVSPRVVLTAAHCVNGSLRDDASLIQDAERLASPYQVIESDITRSFAFAYGSHNQEDGSANVINVEKVIYHPNYSSSEMISDGQDFAMLILERQIEDVEPIQLIDDEVASTLLEFSPATALGWGYVNAMTEEDSLHALQEKELIYFSNQTCSTVVSTLPEDSFCAGDFNEQGQLLGTGVCEGDSGGPLFVEYNGEPYQIGLTSGGRRAFCQGPAVLVELAHYVEFIRGVIFLAEYWDENPMDISSMDLDYQSDRLLFSVRYPGSERDRFGANRLRIFLPYYVSGEILRYSILGLVGSETNNRYITNYRSTDFNDLQLHVEQTYENGELLTRATDYYNISGIRYRHKEQEFYLGTGNERFRLVEEFNASTGFREEREVRAYDEQRDLTYKVNEFFRTNSEDISKKFTWYYTTDATTGKHGVLGTDKVFYYPGGATKRYSKTSYRNATSRVCTDDFHYFDTSGTRTSYTNQRYDFEGNPIDELTSPFVLPLPVDGEFRCN